MQLHPHAAEYLSARIREHLKPGCDVLEIGSYNVNGSVREFSGVSQAGTYFGIDMRDGPGVDHVIRAEHFDGQEGYDVALCAEMLEHASDPEGVIRAAYRSLRPGGVLILTAAAPERTPHNNNGDHNAFEPGEHYGGIDPGDLARWLEDWEVLNLEHHPDHGDVRATARKLNA